MVKRKANHQNDIGMMFNFVFIAASVQTSSIRGCNKMAPSCIYNAAGIRGQSAQTCSSSVAFQDFLRDCISSNLFKESRSERSGLRDPKKSEGCDWQGSVPAESVSVL